MNVYNDVANIHKKVVPDKGFWRINANDRKINTLMLTEICGCLAEMLFDIFAKEGGIGETEQVADLLNAVVSLLQVVTDVL